MVRILLKSDVTREKAEKHSPSASFCKRGVSSAFQGYRIIPGHRITSALWLFKYTSFHNCKVVKELLGLQRKT